jgi:hypothetical protein
MFVEVFVYCQKVAKEKGEKVNYKISAKMPNKS